MFWNSRKLLVALPLITVLWLSPIMAAAYFVDVRRDAFYTEAVDWAAYHGITTGTSETTFSPGEPVTRAEVVTFLYRYDQLLGDSGLGPAPANLCGLTANEEAFVDAINVVRAQAGVVALSANAELSYWARDHAVEMASVGDIYHDPQLTAESTYDWRAMGENVGVGPSVEVLMDAFVDSPGHYANIVNPDYSHVGVGVGYTNDAMYTTHRFLGGYGVDSC